MRVIGCLCVSALMTAVSTAALSAEETGPAQAQSSGPEEIVVTAQKRTESLQNVPITISAVSGKTLSSVGIQTSTQLGQVTPNLSFAANADNVAPYIRGVGSQFAGSGLESSVPIYFDDQYIVRPSASLFTLSDVERVEVLKGPQGTLYGRNSTGGAVRIITADPKQKFEGGGSVTYGSYDRIVGSAFVNLPLSDTLAARFSADYDDMDGYVRNVDPSKPRLQDRHQITLHGKVLWEPTDSLRFKLSADHTNKKDHEGQAFLPYPNSSPEQLGAVLGSPLSPGFYKAVSSLPYDNSDEGKLRTKSTGVTLRADYVFDAFTLSSISGYRKIFFAGPADADTSNLVLLDVGTIGQPTRSFSQEVQAVSNGDGPLKWTVGAYFYRERSEYEYAIWGTLSGMPLDSYFGSNGRIAVTSFAPYGQVSYEITPQWEATFGARYTTEKKRLRGNTLEVGALDAGGYPDGDTAVSVGEIPEDRMKFKKFTPRAVLTYKPVDDVMLYASFSRGFKSGGYNLPSFGVPDEVDPETLTAYELGWKTEFGAFRFNGAVFHNDEKNLQVQLINSSGVNTLQNAASAKIYGIETDITMQATDNLELGVGGGYLHSKFGEYMGSEFVPASSTPACAAAPGTAACSGYLTVPADLSGNRLPVAPRLTGYGKVRYTYPFSDGSKITADALLSYTSSYNYDAAEQSRERARATVNGSVGWTSPDEHYQISVFGTNIFDRKSTVYKTYFATGGWYIPSRPAEFGVRAGVRF